MTPKVAKRGGSFKGAAAYYLHDKGADTSRRVAFSVTRNLPVAEPELAWRWMAYTAKHAGILKHDAGVARSGTKMSKPVYTLSLSWDPKEAKPAPDEMLRAMEDALKKIGLAKCQALLVAHKDTDHPHIHAIVNLVDPDSGKIVKLSRDHTKLSQWAQSFETAQGQIRCHRRVENNARREKGEWVVDRHSKTRQDLEQAKLIEREILAGRRRAQWDRQVADRASLKRQAVERSPAIRAELKERFKPQWAAFYKKQRQDARDVKNARRSVLAAMRVAIKERRRLKPDGRAGLGAILAYTISARALGDALAAAQERELSALRERMNEARKEAVKAVWDGYGRDYRALKDAQAEARKEPPSLPPTEEAARRMALKAELEARAAAERAGAEAAAREKAAPEAPAQREPRDKVVREKAKEPAPQKLPRTSSEPHRDEKRPAPRARPLHRAGNYDALKAATPKPALPPTRETPAQQADEKDRRREQLKAEFRQQAEEIARRRRERKQKDRDRDRER
jgi:MobA/VirD2-like, nuclease domain